MSTFLTKKLHIGENRGPFLTLRSHKARILGPYAVSRAFEQAVRAHHFGGLLFSAFMGRRCPRRPGSFKCMVHYFVQEEDLSLDELYELLVLIESTIEEESASR